MLIFIKLPLSPRSNHFYRLEEAFAAKFEFGELGPMNIILHAPEKNCFGEICL